MEIVKFWACESFRRPPLVNVLKKIRGEMDTTEWRLGAGVANADEDDDELGHVVLRNEAGVANLRAVDVVGVGNAPSVGSLPVVGLCEPLAMLLARRGKWRTLMICDSWKRCRLWSLWPPSCEGRPLAAALSGDIFEGESLVSSLNSIVDRLCARMTTLSLRHRDAGEDGEEDIELQTDAAVLLKLRGITQEFEGGFDQDH